MSQSQKQFERFYNDHFDRIYRFIFFRVGLNKEVAEDLVSEIFMKALKAFDGYDETISQSAWISTIARNHLINHWRDQKTTIALPEGDNDPERTNDPYFFKEALAAFKKTAHRQETLEVVAKLGSPEQEIVTFHYLLGYSYKEIAEELGMTEGAVKVAAHRALKKMRTWL